MCDNRFYRCGRCGTIIEMIHDGGHPLMCCGTEMEHLIPKTCSPDERCSSIPALRVHKKNSTPEECCKTPDTDVCTSGNCDMYCIAFDCEKNENSCCDAKVRWVYLQTTAGGHRKCISPGKSPEVCFSVTDEHPTAVYAYSERDGLLMTEIRLG